MKAKKFLALVLALVMALSCMSLTALAGNKNCPDCEGKGKIDCTNEACHEGKVTCTNCGGDGKVECGECSLGGCMNCGGTGKDVLCSCSCRCFFCNGYGILGVCTNCDGTGRDSDDDECLCCDGTGAENDEYGETCGDCNGTGYVSSFYGAHGSCEDCDSTGATCPDCEEHEYVTNDGIKYCVTCDEEMELCDECKGEGNTLWDCSDCNGTGISNCSSCGGTGNCSSCGGSQEVTCTSCDETGKAKCKPCDGNGSINCPTCNGTKTVEVFSENFTVNIPEITVGSTKDDIKNGIKLDETIASEIEVVDVRIGTIDGEEATLVESVTTAGQYAIEVVFKLKTTAYASFDEGDEQGSYAKTVTFNRNNTPTDALSVVVTEYHSDSDAIDCSGFPYLYLISGIMFEIAENDGNDTTIDQLYDVNITENQTDVTKVQVSWELSNIQASVTSNKIWDTKNLEWIDDTTKENGATATNGTAKFTFVNLSSVKMDAEVTFAVAEGFTAITPEFSNSKITLGTKADGEAVKNNGEITVTVTPNAEDFATLTEDATNVKYGTYTVTIRKHTDTKAKYLRFTANEDNSSVTPKFVGGSDLQYRINGGEWTDRAIDSTDAINLANAGDYVELKGENCTTTWIKGIPFFGIPGTPAFVMTGSISASGDVTSITNGIGGDVELTANCYYGMFAECTSLTTAPALPAKTLANSCYNNMFYGCTSLSTAPALPAETLANSCYSNMFNGCTSLSTAPALPATTLAENCYSNMFNGCTSLSTAPATLPATTLANSCYAYMFSGCTSLTDAPKLSAETLAEMCYTYMFSGCTSLTTAPALPATTLANMCYKGMFRECTSLTNAPKLPAETLANSCYQEMFQGCTSLTNAPALPATTLADVCYTHMFAVCTSLTTAPELPATTLAIWCYAYMFSGCTNLTTAPELPAETLAWKCYAYMFSGCTKLTDAPVLPAKTLAEECYRNMFFGCTSLTTAPATLPATTLANNCYDSMFAVCTSLTTAPELPATTLANKCYQLMFLECESLNITTTKPTTGTEGVDYGVILSGEKEVGDGSLNNMFQECSRYTTDFIHKDPETGKDITYYWYK